MRRHRRMLPPVRADCGAPNSTLDVRRWAFGVFLSDPLYPPLAFAPVPAIIPADVGSLRQPGRPLFTPVSLLGECGPPLLTIGFPTLRGGVSFGPADCLPLPAPFSEPGDFGFADHGPCILRCAPPI